MGRRDAWHFGPPTQVVVTRPSKSDTGLLNAWSFCSDETVQSELDKEVKLIGEIKSWIAKTGLRAGIDVARYQGSLYRVSRIARLQKLREAQKSGVQDFPDVVE